MKPNPNIVAAVFARGGSKGLPGKNLKELGGVSLVGRAVEIAKSIDGVSEVLVSTDSDEIANEALKHGALVPFMRPIELSQDGSPEIDAWKHMINQYSALYKREIDILISIPPTAPLRRVEDVKGALGLFSSLADADLVITITKSIRNPFFDMVTKYEDSKIEKVVEASGSFHRRQDAPTVFDITPVAYIAKAEFVLENFHLLNGNVYGYEVPRSVSLDIDTEEDFAYAEFLEMQG
ncbi:MAG: acylneuraminate cytidylyltransferase family protein [Acidimicrobiales bacterium]|nr:acylneuraminate cytidylyltransferase family protein [Acidimicrobiales bacterium]